MAGNTQHIGTIGCQLFLANAADAHQFVQGLRLFLRNGRQGGVVKNHLRGQIVRLGHVGAPSLERAESLLACGIQFHRHWGQSGRWGRAGGAG